MFPFHLLFLVIILASLSLNFCSTVPSLDWRQARPLALGLPAAWGTAPPASCFALGPALISPFFLPPRITCTNSASRCLYNPGCWLQPRRRTLRHTMSSISLALSVYSQGRKVNKASLSSCLSEPPCCRGHAPANPASLRAAELELWEGQGHGKSEA